MELESQPWADFQNSCEPVEQHWCCFCCFSSIRCLHTLADVNWSWVLFANWPSHSSAHREVEFHITRLVMYLVGLFCVQRIGAVTQLTLWLKCSLIRYIGTVELAPSVLYLNPSRPHLFSLRSFYRSSQDHSSLLHSHLRMTWLARSSWIRGYCSLLLGLSFRGIVFSGYPFIHLFIPFSEKGSIKYLPGLWRSQVKGRVHCDFTKHILALTPEFIYKFFMTTVHTNV